MKLRLINSDRTIYVNPFWVKSAEPSAHGYTVIRMAASTSNDYCIEVIETVEEVIRKIEKGGA